MTDNPVYDGVDNASKLKRVTDAARNRKAEFIDGSENVSGFANSPDDANAQAGFAYLGDLGVRQSYLSPYPDIEPDKIPKMARTIGYVIAAAYAILSPLVLGFANLWFPADVNMIAQSWVILGTAVTGYAGFVGVMYRPTR